VFADDIPLAWPGAALAYRERLQWGNTQPSETPRRRGMLFGMASQRRSAFQATAFLKPGGVRLPRLFTP